MVGKALGLQYKSMTEQILKKKSLAQLIRYGVIGLLINSIGYLIYILITYLGVPPKIAMSILYIIATTLGFIANRKWTFAHNGHYLKAGAKYILAHLVGYFINLSLLLILVDIHGYPHQWVQAAAIFIVAGYLFIAFKFFVFPDNKN